jgi:hypothetical protein
LFDISSPADDDPLADKDVWVYEDGAIAVVHGHPDSPLSVSQAAMLRDALTAALLARDVIQIENS